MQLVLQHKRVMMSKVSMMLANYIVPTHMIMSDDVYKTVGDKYVFPLLPVLTVAMPDEIPDNINTSTIVYIRDTGNAWEHFANHTFALSTINIGD